MERQESHIHSLMNVLRYCNLDESLQGEPSLVCDSALDRLYRTKELDYMSYIVLRLFENTEVGTLDSISTFLVHLFLLTISWLSLENKHNSTNLIIAVNQSTALGFTIFTVLLWDLLSHANVLTMISCFSTTYIFFCNLLNSFHGISILSWTLPNIICNLVALWSALLHMKLNCCKISRKNLRNLHGLEVRCWNRILGPIADHILETGMGGVYSLCSFATLNSNFNISMHRCLLISEVLVLV